MFMWRYRFFAADEAADWQTGTDQPVKVKFLGMRLIYLHLHINLLNMRMDSVGIVT